MAADSTFGEGSGSSGLVETGKEKAQEGLTKAKETAQEGLAKAKETGVEKAKETGGKAREQVARRVDERSTSAGEQVASVAEATRKVGSELREQGQETPARLVEQAAGQAERLGQYLKDGNSDRFVRDLEDAARRQPWAVAAGAFVLGIAGARFLKASAARRHETASEDSPVVRGEARRLAVSEPIPEAPSWESTEPQPAR